MDVSGAYWRGSEKNRMVRRVHGTLWPDGGQLEAEAGGAGIRLRAGEDLGMLGLSEMRDRLRQAVEMKGAP